jgi:predicted transcriptional regulator
MPKEAVFTMKLDPELRAAFMAEAANEDRPASQVVRELMRGYIVQRRKVEAARADKEDGRSVSTYDVEAELAATGGVSGPSLWQVMSDLPATDGIEFDPPRLNITLRVPDFDDDTPSPDER